MYEIKYHPRALKFLAKITSKEKRSIIKKIELLQTHPFPAKLQIRKLVTTKRSYRLRTGEIRVIFEIDSVKKIIYIHKIGFRGNIY